MGLTAQLIGNRKWTEDANGSITSLTRRYQIIRDGIPSGTAAEEVTSARTEYVNYSSFHFFLISATL